MGFTVVKVLYQVSVLLMNFFTLLIYGERSLLKLLSVDGVQFFGVVTIN